MRKAAYIINIVGAALAGFGIIASLVASLLWPSISELVIQQVQTTTSGVQLEVVVSTLNTYAGLLWTSFGSQIVSLGVLILAIILNKNAKSKSGAIAPAILSIIFGGLLGIVAGILLLVAKDEEFAQPIA